MIEPEAEFGNAITGDLQNSHFGIGILEQYSCPVWAGRVAPYSRRSVHEYPVFCRQPDTLTVLSQ